MFDASLLTAIEHGEIHVWYADTGNIPTAQLPAKYLALLDRAELERYQRFYFDRDRLTYLAAHALVRNCLSRYVACPPESWRFEFGNHGKPEIASRPGMPPLRFNLSHTQGLVACVIALDTDCGIDVESISRVTDMRGIAKMVFSESENIYLDAQAESAWPHNFFSLWTLKEAYVKATGLGLSTPLKKISFDTTGSQTTVCFDSDVAESPDKWLFYSHHLGSTHLMAVAARKSGGNGAIVYRAFNLLPD